MASTSNKSQEQSLVEGLRQKDEKILEQVYDMYGATLYGIVLKITRDAEVAEDIIQEAFVKIWHKIDSYDAKKGRFFTWMLNISRNLAIDYLRSKQNKMKQKVRPLDISVDINEPGLAGTMNVDQIGLTELVNQLKPDNKIIIDYLYFKGYTQAECSDELGIPLGTVKSRLRIALRELRKWTSEESGD